MLVDFKKERYDIILQAGQSNSEGYGLGDIAEPFEPDDRVWYLTAEGVICKAEEQMAGDMIRANPSLGFARAYLKNGLLEQGRKLLILRAAVGGTGFSDHRWGMEDDLYLQMMQMVKTALRLNPDNRLVFFFWHQGETDAINLVSYETHYENLMRLVRSVRDTYAADLPFVAGEFVQEWLSLNKEICQPVLKAMEDVCARVGHASYVHTEGLRSNHEAGIGDDNIHFCREASYQLGERYFEAFMKIRGAK